MKGAEALAAAGGAADETSSAQNERFAALESQMVGVKAALQEVRAENQQTHGALSEILAAVKKEDVALSHQARIVLHLYF